MKPIRIALGLVIMGLAPLAGAAAALTNSGQVSVAPNFSGGTGPFTDNQNKSVIDISGSATGGFSSSGSAVLHVEPGIIKMSGEASGSLNTVVRGIVQDTLTIDVPGVAPNSASVSFPLTMLLSGSLAVNDAGVNRAGWSLTVYYSALTADISATGALLGGGSYAQTRGPSGDALDTIVRTVTVPVGVPLALNIELDGSAQASYSFDGGVSTASFDLTHSLYWGGVDHVTMNGLPITDFSVVSASGADYKQSFAPAVPEPATALMLAAGLAVIGAGRPRHRRKWGDPVPSRSFGA